MRKGKRRLFFLITGSTGFKSTIEAKNAREAKIAYNTAWVHPAVSARRIK